MLNKIYPFIAIFGFLATSLSSQVVVPENWNVEKIKGTRFVPYAYHSGNPFLNDNFAIGEIELVDGTIIGDIQLHYSEYQDQLIYFNSAISAQIIIDKSSIKGFTLKDGEGIKRKFRQYFDGVSIPKNCFFEILDEGEITLLSYRKVNMEPCAIYRDIFGRRNNLCFNKSYTYFLYKHEKRLEPFRINKKSFLSKFDKPNQKVIKKLLRKNSIFILDETEFLKGWHLIREKGIEVNF